MREEIAGRFNTQGSSKSKDDDYYDYYYYDVIIDSKSKRNCSSFGVQITWNFAIGRRIAVHLKGIFWGGRIRSDPLSRRAGRALNVDWILS